MHFNSHSRLVGLHSFLSPSKYHWVNYGDDKLDASYLKHRAAQRGSDLHEFAKEAIRLGVRMASNEETLNAYVNDAIDLGLTPEQVLYFSNNCFGSADAVGFDEQELFLRVHDLKTGETPTSFSQLEVYAAIFCLEYGYRPFEIQVELRIYQNNEVKIKDGDPDVISHIIEQIIRFDRRIEELKKEAY